MNKRTAKLNRYVLFLKKQIKDMQRSYDRKYMEDIRLEFMDRRLKVIFPKVSYKNEEMLSKAIETAINKIINDKAVK